MVLAPSPGIHRLSARIPLVLEDGLFALHLEPLGEGDPCFETLRKYTITRKAKFVPSDSGENVRWQAKMLAVTSSPVRYIGGLPRALAHLLRSVLSSSLDSSSSAPLRYPIAG
jgi:hypothetical protein